MDILSLVLNLILLIGAVSLFFAVLAIFGPKEEKAQIVDVKAQRFKSSSSFASLQPENKIIDRLAVFCLNTFHLEKPLEEIHMQLGSPDYPQPINILYWKVICALAVPVAIIIMFQTVFGIFFVPLGFYLPDIMLKSKIQKRQAEILGNFSTTVDLAALIIESGLDYLTAFERIISIAKVKTVLEYIATQIKNGLKDIEDIKKVVIAYEPVWAIGTGKTATAEQANETIAFIRKTIGEMFCPKCAQAVRIQYGGSMNAGNCKELMAMEEIDGGLIGGASLKADAFAAIVNFDK